MRNSHFAFSSFFAVFFLRTKKCEKKVRKSGLAAEGGIEMVLGGRKGARGRAKRAVKARVREVGWSGLGLLGEPDFQHHYSVLNEF